MYPIREFAPAKINLYLHIIGRRADGYHDLDSLAVFTGVGDEIVLEKADQFNFYIKGIQAERLEGEDPESNLAVKAVRSLAALVGKPLDVKITLTKNLPVASGIGGGSSDAAAALRALARHWGIALNDPRLHAAAVQHGQDVPVCLKASNTYITATGTAVGPELPRADIVLVNLNKPLATPAVYKAFRDGGFAFTPEARLSSSPPSVGELVSELRQRGNDLFEPALRLMPDIGMVMDTLRSSTGCMLARMSGSGATCFGIYPAANAAHDAAKVISAAHPDWWVTSNFIPFER
jgi:4-diphosphocytidyl-2-C-methyl-D-erythritol kinase